MLYVLLKALPPVCMKHTAKGEANIAQGIYVVVTRLSPRTVAIFYTNEATVFYVFYCILHLLKC